jgi:hypothetical protein
MKLGNSQVCPIDKSELNTDSAIGSGNTYPDLISIVLESEF